MRLPVVVSGCGRRKPESGGSTSTVRSGVKRPRTVPSPSQSAVVALVSLVVPLLAGLSGRPSWPAGLVTLGAPARGRGDYTHLVLVRLDSTGAAHPLEHAGSAMLRGLARADGFAVIAPGTDGAAGDRVPFVALPILPGSRP